MLKTKKLSEETRQKMSQKAKDRCSAPEYKELFKNRVQSDDAKKKRKETMKNNKNASKNKIDIPNTSKWCHLIS